MKRWLALITVLSGCAYFRRPEPPPQPEPEPPPPRVDTVVVVREVPPPLPEATEAEVCLSTGYAAQIWITPTGDTLVADRRVSIRDLRPNIVFEGAYAEGRDWYAKGTVIRFERRDYQRIGAPGTMECGGLKRIGTHDGIPLFADLLGLSPIEVLHVPVRPGVFHSYRTRVRR